MTTIIQRIADAILEARIKSWSLATQFFLWLGDKSAALRCWTSMRALIARRSDGQVERMDKARGLR